MSLMPTDAEMLVDRQRLRRKLSLWRVLAVLGAIATVVTAGLVATGRTPLGVAQSHVARISIDGFISGDQRMTDLFRRVGESNAIAAVVISINSPGGSTTGAEELYRGIRGLAEKKPVVAFVDGMAASGGYIAALGAERIVARETSLVGSIGVLFQYPNASELLDKIGIKVEEVKSSPLKAAPSPFSPTSPEARAALARVVEDTYGWFKGLVADRRPLSEAEVAAVADGRIHSGRQALSIKLVDQLGSERDAVAWLEREKNVTRDLPVRDWKPRRDRDFDLWTAAAASADLFGFEGVARRLHAAARSAERLKFEGLLALWQPLAE